MNQILKCLVRVLEIDFVDCTPKSCPLILHSKFVCRLHRYVSNHGLVHAKRAQIDDDVVIF